MEGQVAQSRSAEDRLAAALMPVVLHRLNNTTQLLSSLNALLALDRGNTLLEQRAGDLAYAARAADELGWVLAVLASASGAEVLLERRRRGGLAPLLETVRDALRRDGSDLEVPADLPDLDPSVGAGWELPWAIAAWLWTARRSCDGEFSWELSSAAGASRLTCTGADAGVLAELASSIRARLADCRFVLGAREASFELPSRSLAPREAGS